MVAQMDIPIDPTMNQFTEQNESDATVDSDAGEEEEEGDWIRTFFHYRFKVIINTLKFKNCLIDNIWCWL